MVKRALALAAALMLSGVSGCTGGGHSTVKGLSEFLSGCPKVKGLTPAFCRCVARESIDRGAIFFEGSPTVAPFWPRDISHDEIFRIIHQINIDCRRFRVGGFLRPRSAHRNSVVRRASGCIVKLTHYQSFPAPAAIDCA